MPETSDMHFSWAVSCDNTLQDEVTEERLHTTKSYLLLLVTTVRKIMPFENIDN